MSTPSTSSGFPLPSSLKVIAGTERAQAAYPYTMQFAKEDDTRFWFYNSMHFPEPMSAFDMVTAEAAYCALGAANTRVHCLPTTLGIDYRVINGRVYIGGNAVTDPTEIARRTEEFQKRAFYYYANWERLYTQWRAKMLALIEEARALPAVSLPEFEPLEHVHAGRGIASNHDLLDIYQKTLEGYFRMWHHHFEFLLLGYGAYLTFFAFCKKAFPEITDQTIARMVAGIEAEIFRPDDELRRLGTPSTAIRADGRVVRQHREGLEPHVKQTLIWLAFVRATKHETAPRRDLERKLPAYAEILAGVWCRDHVSSPPLSRMRSPTCRAWIPPSCRTSGCRARAMP
jgi:pyruvate,water dikinase